MLGAGAALGAGALGVLGAGTLCTGLLGAGTLGIGVLGAGTLGAGVLGAGGELGIGVLEAGLLDDGFRNGRVTEPDSPPAEALATRHSHAKAVTTKALNKYARPATCLFIHQYSRS
jgi:hypothetical protein